MIPIMLLRRSRNHFVTVSPVRKPSALSPASATLIGMAELSLWSTERRSQDKTPELWNITLDWRAECSRNAGTNILLTSGTIILDEQVCWQTKGRQHLVRHLLEYRAESSDIQPHHQVLQTVPAGEVSHHVRVSWSYAQRQVRILLNLST